MAAATHELLLPRSPGGMVPGAALALLTHGLLLVALTTVVQWRASPPESMSAELWSAVPQVGPPPAPPAPEPAARPAPPPVPQPTPAAAPPKPEPALPDPQIAIAQAKAERERAERDRAERIEKERQRKELAAQTEARKRELLAREQKAEEERVARQRQKNLERMMGQVGSAGGSLGATGAQTSGPPAPSASYTGKQIAAIKPNIVFTDTIRGNPAAEVEVKAGPSGVIVARRISRSSGDKDWDEAVLRAIDRTATLPRDVDGRVPPVITIVFRPLE